MNIQELKVIKNVTQTLKNGGVILYPTDTIWGIGCDATNKEAIKKVYAIKKREKEKSLIILVNNTKMLEKYIKQVPNIAYKIIEKQIEPTTIIYQNPIKLPDLLTDKNTVAIRVIKEKNINKLLEDFDKPITSTSANISNQRNPNNFSEIDDDLSLIHI